MPSVNAENIHIKEFGQYLVYVKSIVSTLSYYISTYKAKHDRGESISANAVAAVEQANLLHEFSINNQYEPDAVYIRIKNFIDDVNSKKLSKQEISLPMQTLAGLLENKQRGVKLSDLVNYTKFLMDDIKSDTSVVRRILEQEQDVIGLAHLDTWISRINGLNDVQDENPIILTEEEENQKQIDTKKDNNDSNLMIQIEKLNSRLKYLESNLRDAYAMIDSKIESISAKDEIISIKDKEILSLQEKLSMYEKESKEKDINIKFLMDRSKIHTSHIKELKKKLESMGNGTNQKNSQEQDVSRSNSPPLLKIN